MPIRALRTALGLCRPADAAATFGCTDSPLCDGWGGPSPVRRPGRSARAPSKSGGTTDRVPSAAAEPPSQGRALAQWAHPSRRSMSTRRNMLKRLGVAAGGTAGAVAIAPSEAMAAVTPDEILLDSFV